MKLVKAQNYQIRFTWMNIFSDWYCQSEFMIYLSMPDWQIERSKFELWFAVVFRSWPNVRFGSGFVFDMWLSKLCISPIHFIAKSFCILTIFSNVFSFWFRKIFIHSNLSILNDQWVIEASTLIFYYFNYFHNYNYCSKSKND